MNSTSSARASANSDRYSASGLTADETASSGPTLERSTSRSAPRAANGTTHRGRDHGDRDHARRRARCDAGRRATAGARRARRWMPRPAAATASARRDCATRATAGSRAGRRCRARSRRARRSTTGPSDERRAHGRAAEEQPERDHRRAPPARRAYAARSVAPRQQQRARRCPTRNTMSAGTSRLRYVPTGRSTVTRSFHANSAPDATLAEPAQELERDRRGATGRRAGCRARRRRSTSSPATSQPPQRRLQASAAIAAATSAADADQQQERPVAVDRPRGDRGDRDHGARRTAIPRRCAARAGASSPTASHGAAATAAPAVLGAHEVAPRRSSPDRSSSVPTVSTVSPDSALHARVGALVADHRDDRRVGGEAERSLPQPRRAAPASRRRRTRSTGARSASAARRHTSAIGIVFSSRSTRAEAVEHRPAAMPPGCAGSRAAARAPRAGSRTR